MKNDFDYTEDDLTGVNGFKLLWYVALGMACAGLIGVIVFAAVGGDTYVPQVPPFSCGK